MIDFFLGELENRFVWVWTEIIYHTLVYFLSFYIKIQLILICHDQPENVLSKQSKWALIMM